MALLTFAFNCNITSPPAPPLGVVDDVPDSEQPKAPWFTGDQPAIPSAPTGQTASPVMLGPNITGRARLANSRIGVSVYDAQGALNPSSDLFAMGMLVTSSLENMSSLEFLASRSSPLYGASSTVQPLAASVQYLIKY